MAEIKDIYSLEFNSSQFTAELDAAIGRIEELNGAMEDGADASEALAAAENNLVSVLKTDAKTTEGLNQKRDALVKTQKTLNNESKTGVAVGKQVDATNKQLAASTGQVAAQQKSLGGQLLQGARSLNSLKRAAGLVTGAFRLLGAFNPLGMFLMVLPTVVGWFQKLTGTTDKGAEAMEKLKDNSLGYTERLGIIQDELERLEAVEARRGYLTEAEKENRQELTAMYQKTADEIVKIEEDRYQRQLDLELQLQATRVKILGDTAAGAIASAELERKKLLLGLSKRRDQILDDSDKLFKELKDAKDEFDKTSSADANIRAIRVQAALDRNFQEELNLIEEQNLNLTLIEQEKNKKLQAIGDRARADQKAKEDKAEADRIQAIKDQIKNTEDILKYEILLTEDGTKARLDAELKLLTVMMDMDKQYAKDLQITDQALLLSEQETNNKKLALTKTYYDNENKLRVSRIQKAIDSNYEALQNEKKALEESSQYRQNNAETNLQIALLYLEKERNAELLNAFGNAEAQDEINKEYNAKRTAYEIQTNKEILSLRIELLKKLRDATNDPLALSEVNKQIAELETQFETLQTTTEESVDKTAEKWKEAVETAAQYIQLGSDAVFQVLNAQVAAYISNLDNAISRSKSTLDEIRSQSENFNARQLELERDRLEKLEEERRKAVERERAIALVQLTVNSLLAISKAAAEGAGAGAPFTIASTIIALIAGFAAARAAAGNAFYEGSEYVDRNNRYPNGRDTVPGRLNKGERVIKTDTNQQYWDSLSAIHHGRIPADVINDFVNNYKKGGSPSMDSIFLSDFGVKPVIFNGSDNSVLENRLGRIEIALLELPKYMPQTTVTANANGIFKIVERRQAGRNFSRNRAK